MKTFTPMIRKSRLAIAASLVFALGCPVAAIAAATGTVTYQGDTWIVADAIAYEGGGGIKLAFSKLPWDRAAWAENGEFEDEDVFKLDQGAIEPHLQIGLSRDGKYFSHRMIKQRGLGEGGGFAATEALSLKATGPDRVQGSFKFADADYNVDLTFDLDVLKSGAALPFPGSPLASDGGVPGEVLLATLAATASGDIEKLLALSPPDRREMLKAAAQEPDFVKKLALQKSFSPTAVKISSGSQLDDRAWLSFTGLKDGKPIRGSAQMVRVDGQWYLRSLKTKE